MAPLDVLSQVPSPLMPVPTLKLALKRNQPAVQLEPASPAAGVRREVQKTGKRGKPGKTIIKQSKKHDKDRKALIL